MQLCQILGTVLVEQITVAYICHYTWSISEFVITATSMVKFLFMSLHKVKKCKYILQGISIWNLPL